MIPNRVAAAALALAAFAQQVFIPVSIEELCGMSDVIVDGSVAQVKTARVAQGLAQGKIETPVEIAISAVLKGPAELKVLEMIEPGGKLGGRDEVYFNQIIPAAGERYILFLTKDGDAYRALGGLHGQYRVVGGRIAVHPAMARILRSVYADAPVEKLLTAIRGELKKPEKQ